MIILCSRKFARYRPYGKNFHMVQNFKVFANIQVGYRENNCKILNGPDRSTWPPCGKLQSQKLMSTKG